MQINLTNKATTLLRVYLLLAGGLLGVVSFLLTFFLFTLGLLLLALTLAVTALLYLYIPAYVRSWRIRLDQDILFVEYGNIFTVSRQIPIANIRYVSVAQSVIDRAMGAQTLVVHAPGKRVLLPMLDSIAAVELASTLTGVMTKGGGEA